MTTDDKSIQPDALAELLESPALQRYLGARHTLADEAEVHRLALRAGRDPADMEGLRALVEKGEQWRLLARKTGLDPELIWDRVAASHAPAEPSPRVLRLELPSSRAASWWVGVAAAAITVVAAGTFAWVAVLRGRAGEMRTLATQAGQRFEYRLPDGSRVTLAPESKLRFSVGTAGLREVELEGEAYFEVTHDETRPFRVRIAQALVEDLGTEFIVRAYPGDASPRVAVRSGVVSVRPPETPASAGAVLEAGEVVTVDARGRASKVVADTSAIFGWVAGQLVFRDAPLSEILAQMHRWYGLDVQSADSTLLATEFTLAIADRTTPAEAVAYVAALAKARVEQRNSAFVLYRQ